MRQSQTTVTVYNLALAWLGGEQLSSVEAPWEDSALGHLCINNFPQVLDQALAAHDWSFARSRKVLARKPDDGSAAADPLYPYRYALPADCLRPVRLYAPGGSDRTASYLIEGLDLLTDLQPAELLYVARVEDPRRWPAGFVTALSWGLAAVLSSAKNNDPQKQMQCLKNYEMALAEAVARDQNAIRPIPPASKWRAARRGEL
jgi:hypothetical protein